jgi:hypothetical protein
MLVSNLLLILLCSIHLPAGKYLLIKLSEKGKNNIEKGSSLARAVV